jgi:hypothetical protein
MQVLQNSIATIAIALGAIGLSGASPKGSPALAKQHQTPIARTSRIEASSDLQYCAIYHHGCGRSMSYRVDAPDWNDLTCAWCSQKFSVYVDWNQ